jgi:fimbrial chaperone protein
VNRPFRSVDIWRQAAFLACALLGLIVAPMTASGFAGYLSPARFELNVKPGEVVREAVTLGNDDTSPVDFEVVTADWTLSAEGSPQFQIDTLAPGSCREWVRVERRRVAMPARGERRFRFEVHVPADAKPQLCRFALLISNATPQASIQLPNIQVPVQGRIGLIVYVGVGNVKPVLSLAGIEHAMFQGRPSLIATIRNSGELQGRLEGVLRGTDKTGRALEFTVSNSVILPGETRSIAIFPPEKDGKPIPYERPLRLQGDMEWAGGKIPVDVSVP